MQLFVLALAALIGVACGVLFLEKASYIRLTNRSNVTRINSKTARESAYDDNTKFLYVIGTETARLHVINVNNPDSANVFYVYNFDLASSGKPLDIELCRAPEESGLDSILAISFENRDSIVNEGYVILYKLFESTLDTLTPIYGLGSEILVGAHPDNMKFTSNCGRLVVANEGIPGFDEGIYEDPEGTVSVITFNTQGSPSKSEINFKTYNTDPSLGELLNKGVRFWMRQNPTNTSQVTTFSQCVEPEYVAISPSNGFAYITLQENNAIARIDLENSVINTIYAMGSKKWESVPLDASDRDNGHVMKPRKVESLYQPDKVAFFTWGDNVAYLVTTDEGKPTAIAGTPFQDYARASSQNWNVGDPELANELSNSAELGRAYVSTIDGFDVTPNIPYLFGGRGFSIWNTQSMSREWESGDDLEDYSRTYYNDTFNGNVDSFNQNPSYTKDTRSPWMGPELSSLAIGKYNDRTVMVFGSGRNGLLYVYVLQPTASNPSPEFQSVYRAGAIDKSWNELYNDGQMGDAMITDIKFSQLGAPIVMVTSEASGSVSVYRVVERSRRMMEDAAEEP